MVRSPALYCVLCPRLNAFAVSNRQEGGIAVTDGMLRTLSYREIRAFLAHKIIHLQHNEVCILLLSCIVGKRVDLVGDCYDFIQFASVLAVWTDSSIAIVVVIADGGSMTLSTPPNRTFAHQGVPSGLGDSPLAGCPSSTSTNSN